MQYEEFKAFMNKAYEMDIPMETMWKLSRLSRDMDEFRHNFSLVIDKDIDDYDDEGEDQE